METNRFVERLARAMQQKLQLTDMQIDSPVSIYWDEEHSHYALAGTWGVVAVTATAFARAIDTALWRQNLTLETASDVAVVSAAARVAVYLGNLNRTRRTDEPVAPYPDEP